MPAIGAWVLERACTTAAAWKEPLKIAVNLSPVQFRQGDIVATVEDALRVSGLPAERLELEITENLWIENTDAVLEQLARLKQIGVSITLDDFGMGDSSLKYLWKFPFDRVKIDRSFVSEMEGDPKAAAIRRCPAANFVNFFKSVRYIPAKADALQYGFGILVRPAIELQTFICSSAQARSACAAVSAV